MCKRLRFVFFIIILYCTGTAVFGRPRAVDVVNSIKQIIADANIDGTFGISALHLESDRKININADKYFPMASTYKIPIAIYCLSLLDQGKIKNQKIKITEKNLRRVCFVSPGQQLPLKTLINLMIEKSDNATSDMILHMVGGGNAVTQWLRKNNINKMHVSRSTRRMCADYSGIKLPNNENDCTIPQYNRLLNKMSKKQRINAAKKFYVDKRDTTTPREMTNLLANLFQGKLISKSSTDFLLQSMLKCTWCKSRIVGCLPKGTKVWHKTGSMDGIVSDVGIIELPNKKNHLVLSMYTNKSTTDTIKRERAMARIAKKLFDYFS